MPITPAGEMVQVASLPPPTGELTLSKDFRVFGLLEQSFKYLLSAGPEQWEKWRKGDRKRCWRVFLEKQTRQEDGSTGVERWKDRGKCGNLKFTQSSQAGKCSFDGRTAERVNAGETTPCTECVQGVLLIK